MGWEVGAIAMRRVPVPLWMLAVNAQAAAGCLASASASPLRDRDRVPGEGVAQEMRVRAIKAGIAKLEVEDEAIGGNGRRRKG